MRLQDKAVLVTGGGSGIGLAMAPALLREGARVAIMDVSEEMGWEAVTTARSEGLELRFLPGDVSRESDVVRMVEAVVREFGRIDVLFHNAGILIEKAVHELGEEEWDRVINGNLKGVFLVSKYVLPPT